VSNNDNTSGATSQNFVLNYRRDHPKNRMSYGIDGVSGIVVIDKNLVAGADAPGWVPPPTIVVSIELVPPKSVTRVSKDAEKAAKAAERAAKAEEKLKAQQAKAEEKKLKAQAMLEKAQARVKAAAEKAAADAAAAETKEEEVPVG
jgi:hypothetical protein